MNRLIASIIMLLLVLIMFAQNVAIEVSYIAHTPSLKDGKTDLTNQYILLANTAESKFYSPKTEYLDSLNSTPEGKAKYQEMTTNAYLGNKMDQIPRKDGTYYILKSLAGNQMKYFDTAGLDKYFYEEQPEEWHWKIGDTKKEILGYECTEASTEYHGRKWTVWFTPEIPIQNGPWKFDGLPGLILEANADGDQYRFVATGIQQTSKPLGAVYLANEYEKTTRKSFLKAKRSFLDNPLGKINAQLGMNVKVVHEDGSKADSSIFTSASVVDLIETDYH